MAHERSPEIARTESFPARFDRVFASIEKLHVPFGIDRSDVAGPELSVLRPAIARLRRLRSSSRRPKAHGPPARQRSSYPLDLASRPLTRGSTKGRANPC